jgi:uncharacterized membrane protein
MATKDSKPKTKNKPKTKKPTVKKKTVKKTTIVKKKTTVKPKKIEKTITTTHKSDTMANEKEDNKLLLLVTYFLGIFSFIIYLIKKDESYIKFHCLQSILLNIAMFIIMFGIMVVGSIFTMVLGALTAGIGGLCGILLVPLSFLPPVYYLYVFYKVFTTGDIEIPQLTEFIKKNLKKYY